MHPKRSAWFKDSGRCRGYRYRNAGIERFGSTHKHNVSAVTPILILSSATKDGITATITALQNGAVDFISKPAQSYGPGLYSIKDELLFKIKKAAEIPLRTLILNNINISKVKARQEKQNNVKSGCTEVIEQIVGIGCGVESRKH